MSYARKKKAEGAEVRLLGIRELCDYLGLGEYKARKFGREAGAVLKFGGRVVYDKKVIDQAIDNMKAE